MEWSWKSEVPGTWSGTTKTWFEPQVLADESPINAEIHFVLGEKFLLYEYRSEMKGDPFQGRLLIGYNSDKNRVECSWVDQFHMGDAILFSVGDLRMDGFSVLGAYSMGDSPEWGWRTQLQIVSKDQIIFRSYNITPEGMEALALETILTRS